jgi:glycosyltransferase involved in cell wall biosynthesis
MAAASTLLTVITPVFNGESFIKETVDSVLENLNGVNYQYIVVNDGSTDKTKEILEVYGARILVLNQENQGESSAINNGLSLAKGKYSLIVNADDPLFTDKLFRDVFEIFELNKELAAVYPDWRIIDSNGVIKKIVTVPEFSDELFIGECRTLPGPGTIFRTNLAQTIGGRNSKWKFVGDYDFWLRLSRVGDIQHRSGVMAQWRQHANSTSIASRGPEMAQERIAVIRDFIENNEITESLKRKALSTSFYMAARLGFFSSEIPAKYYLLQAFKIQRGIIKNMKIYEAVYIILLPLSRWIVNSRLRRLILRLR